MPDTTRSRFEKHVEPIPEGSGCWEWVAYRLRSGYGMFSMRNGSRWVRALAHRAAYEILVGPIPEGLYVLHHCDNPSCVNPSHLFVGTQRDNMRDKISKGRDHNQKKTACPKGHEYDGYNPYLANSRRCSICWKEQMRAAAARYRQRNIETLREKDRDYQRKRRARLAQSAENERGN